MPPAYSFAIDHIPDLRHLNSRDTSFALISCAHIDMITAYKNVMDSSFDQDFNYDFRVTMDESVRPVQ